MNGSIDFNDIIQDYKDLYNEQTYTVVVLNANIKAKNRQIEELQTKIKELEEEVYKFRAKEAAELEKCVKEPEIIEVGE